VILPPRPLRLKPKFVWSCRLGGLGLVLAGIGAAIGYGWWQWSEIQALLEQRQIWETGVEAQDVRVEGHVTSHLIILHGYNLRVEFIDAVGVRHENKIEFSTLGVTVDQASPTVVHHLAGAPERFALSWAMDVTGGRWGAIIFMGVAGVGLIGGSFTFLGIKAWRRLADARRVANRSEEIVARVTKVVPQMYQGRHTGNEYHFTGECDGGRTVTGKETFAVKHTPLHLDPERLTILALVAPEKPDRAVAVRADFHPFQLRDEDRQVVQSAIAAVAASDRPNRTPGDPTRR
jgi:hypothetical protein